MELFSELRRIKQQALPERKDDPVEQAYHDVRVQRAIENVERKIEGVMRDA